METDTPPIIQSDGRYLEFLRSSVAPTMSLGESIRHGAKWLLGGNVASQALQFAFGIVLALEYLTKDGSTAASNLYNRNGFSINQVIETAETVNACPSPCSVCAATGKPLQ